MDTKLSDDFEDEPSVEERYCFCTSEEFADWNAALLELRRQDHANELMTLKLAIFDFEAVSDVAPFNLREP